MKTKCFEDTIRNIQLGVQTPAKRPKDALMRSELNFCFVKLFLRNIFVWEGGAALYRARDYRTTFQVILHNQNDLRSISLLFS